MKQFGNENTLPSADTPEKLRSKGKGKATKWSEKPIKLPVTLGSLDTSRGFTLCVEAETHPGGRKYMEDYVAVDKLGLFEEGGGDSSNSTKA